MSKSISTFCSNQDAFYVSFLQEIDVYYESNLNEVIYCDTDWRGDYNQSCLVALSRFYASTELESAFSDRKNKSALIIHGTWHDEAEHSWWDYLHEMFSNRVEYTFRDDTWYLLHGRNEVHSEFGISLFSLGDTAIPDLLNVIERVYLSVKPSCSSVTFDSYKYEVALLSLKGQSIMDSSWDSYPELLSGLTAAKYLPSKSDVPFTFAVLITLCELLRLVGRARIEQEVGLSSTELANHYQDLLEIGDNIMGGNW